MPRQSGNGWFLKYDKCVAEKRLLISLPVDMLKDAHAAAALQGISAAELARRAMTHHMHALTHAHPQLVLKGESR